MEILKNTSWIKVSCSLLSKKGYGSSYISCSLNDKKKNIRLFNAISIENEVNKYEFFIKNTEKKQTNQLGLSLVSEYEFEGVITDLKVIGYTSK